MKNLKKLLAIVVCVAMMVPTLAFAAETAAVSPSKQMGNATVTTGKYTYTGGFQKAALKVTTKDASGKTIELTEGKDYVIKGTLTHAAAGTYKAIVQGIGKYSGTQTVNYTIAPKAVNSTAGSKRTYTGKAQTAVIKVADGRKVLKEGTDYTVRGTRTHVAAGTYKVVVTGKGNYSGSKVVYYTIGKAAQNSVKIAVNSSKKKISVTGVKGKAKVSYATSNSKVKVSKGVVQVGKGVKKGTRVRITVKVAATANYKAYSKTFTYTVK